MLIRARAILCSSRPHGEHGAIVRLLTGEHGLLAAYLPGARGRAFRALLVPGNVLDAEINARAGHLPSARLELLESRGPWLTEPLPAAGINWTCSLVASVLPEGEPFPAIHTGLAATLDAICHAPSARGWAVALAAFEELVLRELGYGRTADLPAAMPPTQRSQTAEWPELLNHLHRLGKTIDRRLLAERRRDVMGARAILLDRLKRISGEG